MAVATFVFDTLATGTGPRGFLGETPPQALADRVHRIWIDYAKDGSLPWPEFNADTRQVHYLEHGVTRFEPVLTAARFWT